MADAQTRHSTLTSLITQLENQLLECRKTIEQMCTERDELKKERATMLRYIQDMTEKNHRLEATIAEGEDALKQQQDEWNEKIREARASAAKHLKEKVEADAKIHKLRDVVSVTEAALGNERSQNGKLRQQLAKQQVTQKELLEEIEQNKDQLNKLWVEKHTREKQSELHAAENADMTKTIEARDQ